MPFSSDSSKRSRVVRARSTGLGQRRRAAQQGPTDDAVPRLWRGIGYGLAVMGAVAAILWLVGCTVERVVLYETINYPAPAVTASAAVYPQGRTP